MDLIEVRYVFEFKLRFDLDNGIHKALFYE